jgi:hypothetical protein
LSHISLYTLTSINAIADVKSLLADLLGETLASKSGVETIVDIFSGALKLAPGLYWSNVGLNVSGPLIMRMRSTEKYHVSVTTMKTFKQTGSRYQSVT